MSKNYEVTFKFKLKQGIQVPAYKILIFNFIIPEKRKKYMKF